METARRIAAKTIASIERQGGLMSLGCGCIIGMRAKEMRKLIETAGPEEVVKIIDSIECGVHIQTKKKPRKPAKSKRKSIK